MDIGNVANLESETSQMFSESKAVDFPGSPGGGSSAEKVTVLLVEGSAQLMSLRQNLEAEGCFVFTASNSSEALRILEQTVPTLVVMDFALGYLDDWQLLRAVRAQSDIPIIGLCDLGDVVGIAKGFSLGINDYLCKPIDPVELNLRSRVLLSRFDKRRQQRILRERRCGSDRRRLAFGRRSADRHQSLLVGERLCLAAGPFRIDEQRKLVYVEGKAQRLSPKEYLLLRLLMAEPGRAVSNDEIIAHLWPRSTRATASHSQQYMHLLRSKIEKDPKKPRWIETVKGFGYRLAVETDT